MFSRRLETSIACRVIGLFGACVAGSGIVLAQPKEFDVAAIHENRTGLPEPIGIRWTVSPQHFRAQNVTLQELVGIAYLTNVSRVVSRIPWFKTTRFDVDARVDSPGADIGDLLKALLKDRFHLKYHDDPQTYSAMTLLADKNVRLVESAPNESYDISSTARGFTAHKANMLVLVNTLYNYFGTPVVDQTGLKGEYTFTIDLGDSPQSKEEFRDAWERALGRYGLRLEPTRQTVVYLYVDSAEVPSEN